MIRWDPCRSRSPVRRGRVGAAAMGLVVLLVATDTFAGDDDLDEPSGPPAGPTPPTNPEPVVPAEPKLGLGPPVTDPYLAREPAIAPSVWWLVAQAVPSPELVVGDQGPRFGMRWQVTPFLYSFGIHRRLSPIRTLVVEPVVRHAGSIELFLSPEWVAYRGGTTLFDVGVRATLPIFHRGEYLSASLGVAHTSFDGVSGVRYEAGVYVLFGVLGAVVSVSPTPELSPVSTALTLRVRYF